MVNYCDNVTCENKGVCRPLVGDYRCECLSPSLSGRHCEIVARGLAVRKAVSKSIGYIGILFLSGVAGFVVFLDALKYVFRIDPVAAQRKHLAAKKRQPIRKKRTVAIVYQYVNATVPGGQALETIVEDV